MKNLFIATLVATLFSCGSSNLTTRKGSVKENVLFQESYLKISVSKMNEMLKQENTDAVSRATILCHKRDFKSGENILLKNYTQFKEYPEYWNSVGICHFLYGQLAKAEFNFLKAREMSKKSSRQYFAAQNNLANLYHQYGHYEKVRSMLEELIKSDPTLSTPKYNLAHLYLQFNLPGRALNLLESLYFNGLDDIDVLSSLGLAHVMLGNPKDALKYFEKIPNKDKAREDIAAYFAWALYEDGQFEQSVAALGAGRQTDIKMIRDFSQSLRSRVSEALALKIEQQRRLEREDIELKERKKDETKETHGISSEKS